MRVFISGGCKNGKSFYAQRLARGQTAENGRYYYVATMNSTGAEDDVRIERHRRERDGWGFITVEQPVRIEEILDRCEHGASFLLDSVTALLANEMFPPSGRVDETAAERAADGLLKVIRGLSNIVIVSDYIYSDAVLYDPLTEKYRSALAYIDRAAARACDTVLEVAYTNVIVHKGSGTEILDFSVIEGLS